MQTISIYWHDFILSYSAALDLLSPVVVDHHYDVAYIASQILLEIGAGNQVVRETVQAALLHDVGVFSLKDKLAATHFEFEEEDLHAELGAELFGNYEPLAKTASIIRHHHCRYDVFQFSKVVPFESEVVYLADRIAVSIDKTIPILDMRKSVLVLIRANKHTKFNPLLVEAFESLSVKESFWLNLLHDKRTIVSQVMARDPIQMNYTDLMDMTNAFSRVIDFKSRYTAAHSGGVGLISKRLAELLGMSAEVSDMLRFAGVVHDFGKIIIPAEILEKPSIITRDEMSIIRAHPYYTQMILKSIKGLDDFTTIASQHHERLDASGYPYHLNAEDLSRNARLIAVADVFTALTEDRPYRETLKPEKVREALLYFVQNSYLDRELVKVVLDHQDELTKENKLYQLQTYAEYEMIQNAVEMRMKTL